MQRADCFILMPFATEFDRVYFDAIKPAALEAAADIKITMSVSRADEYASPSHITRDIIEMLCRCTCAIADLTGGNPNVFYELGVVHAMGDKTIMIAQNLAELPFDLRNYRVLGYAPDDTGLAQLRHDLMRSLRSILERSPTEAVPKSNPVSDFAPIRLSDVTVSLEHVLTLERQALGEVWILGPDVDIDIRDYVAVMREGILERSLTYKYILPDTPEADRSWRYLEKMLGLPASAESRLLRKIVSEHVIESELVIYNPGSRDECVFLIPPAEDSENIYIRIPRTRATAIRKRFARLWDTT